MKPFLAFFVIFLTAFTLGGILPDPHELARLELARKQAIDESSAAFDSGGVHTCKPGEGVLRISNENEHGGKHFKDCQIELNIVTDGHAKPCFGATFEDCYVSIRGTHTAYGATFIHSVVDVHGSYCKEYWQNILANVQVIQRCGLQWTAKKSHSE